MSGAQCFAIWRNGSDREFVSVQRPFANCARIGLFDFPLGFAEGFGKTGQAQKAVVSTRSFQSAAAPLLVGVFTARAFFSACRSRRARFEGNPASRIL